MGNDQLGGKSTYHLGGIFAPMLRKDRLRKLREAFGSREKFALAVGVSETAIQNWETRNVSPDLNSIAKAAMVLGTTVAYLIGETDEVSPPKPDKFAGLREQFKDLPPDILEKGLTGHYMLDVWEEDMKKMTVEEQKKVLAEIEIELRTIYLERQRAKIQEALRKKGE